MRRVRFRCDNSRNEIESDEYRDPTFTSAAAGRAAAAATTARRAPPPRTAPRRGRRRRQKSRRFVSVVMSNLLFSERRRAEKQRGRRTIGAWLLFVLLPTTFLLLSCYCVYYVRPAGLLVPRVVPVASEPIEDDGPKRRLQAARRKFHDLLLRASPGLHLSHSATVPPSSEGCAAANSPRKGAPQSSRDAFLAVLSEMPNFSPETALFVREQLTIPDGTTLRQSRENDAGGGDGGGGTTIITLDLPASHPSLRVSLDPDAPLSRDDFARLNRYADHADLRYLRPMKRIPPAPINDVFPATPTMKDLTYFRSLGPKVTKELVSGSTLTAGPRRLVLSIRGNRIDFVEGGPHIGATRVSAMEFLALRGRGDGDGDGAAGLDAKKEWGIVKVYTQTGFLLPTLSDEYFVADIGSLLPRMRRA